MTGESVNLRRHEKRAVVACVLEANNKRVPVVLGLGGNNTQEIVAKLRSTIISMGFPHYCLFLLITINHRREE